MTAAGVSIVTGRKVFWYIFGFFGVIVAVNATMVVLALATFNGLSNTSAYTDGLAYNNQLRAINAQRALGWDAKTEISASPDRSVHIVSRYTDRGGQPINRLNITAHFQRPTHEGFDFDVAVTQTGNGVYTSDVQVPLPGLWDVTTEARRDGQPPYILTYRVFVP